MKLKTCCGLLLAAFLAASVDLGYSPLQAGKQSKKGGEKSGLFGGKDKTQPEVQPYSFDFVIDIKVGGARRTTGHTEREAYKYKGETCVRTRTTYNTKVVREGQTFEDYKNQEFITTINGEAIYMNEVKMANGERSELTVKVEGGKARFEKTEGGKTDKSEIDVPAGVLFALDAAYLSRQGLEVGKETTAKVINTRKQSVNDEKGTVIGNKDMTFQGEPVTAWMVRVESSDTKSIVDLTITSDGRLIRMDADVATYMVVDAGIPESQKPVKEEAKTFEVVTKVPTDLELPAWDNFDQIVFTAEPMDTWQECLKDNEYVSVRPGPGLLTIEARSVAPKLPEQIPFPVDRRSLPPEMAGYLKTTPKITPDDPEIKRIAAEVVGKETDALNAVAFLAGWVNEKIKWNSGKSFSTTPRKTLQTLRGDCTEHADLFASLARSVGIPTRHCYGLMLQSKEAVYHNWVEAWLAGVWVPVDTTANRVLLPAGYILTVRDDNQSDDLNDKLPLAMSGNKDKMKLSIVSLHKGEYTLDPKVKKTWVARNEKDNWFANLMWGFSMRLVDDWDGMAQLKYLSVTSKDKTAVFKCEAVSEPYSLTNSELDSIEKTLQNALQKFKKIQSGMVEVNGKSALFLDYTCMVDGLEMRCRQFIIPRRGRSYRVTGWAPAATYGNYSDDFMKMLNSIEID